MEILVILLMVFIGLGFLMKLTFWKKWWMPVIAALLCGGFLLLVWPYSIEQSKTQIADFLNNTSRMLDLSVLLTLEATLGIAYCFVSLAAPHKKGYRVVRAVLHYFMGLSVFIVLFYLQTRLIFVFPGVSFKTIGWLTAVAVVVLIPLARLIIGFILPENELRLEMYFFINLFLLGLTVVCTVNGTVAVDGGQLVDWFSTLGAVSIILAVATAGYAVYQIKTKRPMRKR